MTGGIPKSRPLSGSASRDSVDFYPSDNRISRAEANGATRAYSLSGFGDPYSYKRTAKGKKSPSGGGAERVAARGKATVGEVRREAGQRRKLVQKRRGLLFGISCVLIFLAVIFLVYKFVFVVKEISVVGSEKYSTEQITKASGISAGDNLYSFRTSSVVNSITLNCPYIQEVSVDRNIPNNVSISATEDTAVYYADIYGETKLLSAGLRVLDTVAEDYDLSGLVKLKLPAVSYSVAGREIRFADERRALEIRELLSDVSESALSGRVTIVDIRDQFDAYVVCDGLYKLELGENSDVDYKLRVASKVLEDDMFKTDNKFRLDLTVRGKTGVVMDNQMDLD